MGLLCYFQRFFSKGVVGREAGGLSRVRACVGLAPLLCEQSLVRADQDRGAGSDEGDGEGETAETTSSGSTWMGSYSLQAQICQLDFFSSLVCSCLNELVCFCIEFLSFVNKVQAPHCFSL